MYIMARYDRVSSIWKWSTGSEWPPRYVSMQRWRSICIIRHMWCLIQRGLFIFHEGLVGMLVYTLCIIHCAFTWQVDGHLVDGRLVDRHFVDRTFGRQTFRPQDFSSKGRLVERMFRRQPFGRQTFRWMDDWSKIILLLIRTWFPV